jgi:sugar phosphate isomerase/epimerase
MMITSMGLSPDCFVIARPQRTPLEYLNYCLERGAGGAQSPLTNFDPAYLRQIRARLEQTGAYLEITTSLPQADPAPFEAVVKAARECGARCLRSVCLSGRRYETFNSLEEWRKFEADSKIRLERAVRILDREKFPLGLENHKDWTMEQMPALLQSFSSEYLGACIDWGNNISLLDDPREVIEALAPFCISNHIKDMAVEEFEGGFLLAEVPLGDGFLDLKELLATVRRARPKARYSLDMLTRDPLVVPCLQPKYWVTFPALNGRFLAHTLDLVRKHKPRRPLAYPTKMAPEERLAFEQANVRRSLEYSRDALGL